MTATAPVARVERLEDAARSQAAGALAHGTMAALVAAFLLLICDWSVSRALGGAAIGAVVWGAQKYFFGTAPIVPRGLVEDAPVGIEVETIRYELLDLRALPVLVALCAGIAAYADLVGIGAAFAVGWPLGYSLAHLVTFLRIRRWELANGRRIVVDPSAEGAQLRPYAL